MTKRPCNGSAHLIRTVADVSSGWDMVPLDDAIKGDRELLETPETKGAIEFRLARQPNVLHSLHDNLVDDLVDRCLHYVAVGIRRFRCKRGRNDATNALVILIPMVLCHQVIGRPFAPRGVFSTKQFDNVPMNDVERSLFAVLGLTPP